MRLIDKDALVAEIERRVNSYLRLQNTPEMSDLQEELQNKIDCLNSFKGWLNNTLEVKEVDLEKEMDTYFETMEVLEHEYIFEYTFQRIARHFFELGLRKSK